MALNKGKIADNWADAVSVCEGGEGVIAKEGELSIMEKENGSSEEEEYI